MIKKILILIFKKLLKMFQKKAVVYGENSN